MTRPLRLLSTTALKTTLDALQNRIISAVGNALDVEYGPSTHVAARVGDGEKADGAIATEPGLAELAEAGRIVRHSIVPVARSAIGVAVPRGAPHPDLADSDGFARALRQARAIATSQPSGGGQSGAHIHLVFDRLGLRDDLRPKLRYGTGGPSGLVGLFLLRGEADLAIQQMPELMAVEGIDIVGPLPDALQSVTTFALGTLTASQNAEAVAALAKFLRSPEAVAVMRAKGLTPA